MNEAEIYFNKAIQTCEDSNTTHTTWFVNFVIAYEKLKKENERLEKENKLLRLDSEALQSLEGKTNKKEEL